MKKFCLLLLLLAIVNSMDAADNESPYALFGDVTPILDVCPKSEENQCTLTVIIGDSVHARLELHGDYLLAIDCSGDTIGSVHVNRAAKASFLSIDPRAGEMPRVSPYAFCFANPVNFVDNNGLEPTATEGALMSLVVYRDPNEKELYNFAVDQLKKTGWGISLPPGTNLLPLKKGESPRPMLFERTNSDGRTEYALAYAGTVNYKDVIQDVFQLVGLSPLYAEGIKDARNLSAMLGENVELTFVGHSLGAGRAAAASMATGRKALCYNPAAVSPATKQFNNLGSDVNITNYRIVPSGTGQIRMGGCLINNFQDNLGMPAPGTTICLPMPISNPLRAHGIANFIDFFFNGR